MLFLIALYLTTYGVLSSTEAMVGSAFSMVRRDGDSVPLCAIDQPSAVKSTISAIWCGIECITSSSSTCHSFSYLETINKCDIFFSEPTNYAAEDGCVTHGIINLPPLASIVSTAGTPATSSAAPTSNIPDIISTEQPAAEPSTIDTYVVSPTEATTASDISTADPLVQPTTATSYQPLTIAPLPAPPPPGLMCKASVDPTSSEPWRLLQQNIGNGLDQSWSVYKYGFNDGTGGYWIGNENLHRMTNNGTTCQLCIDMQDKTAGSWFYAHYTSFVVGNESDGYNYNASGFQGNIGVDTFGLSNGFNFSAKDTNTQPCENFAATLKGGWWYPCHATQIVLNGVVNPPSPPAFYWTIISTPPSPQNRYFKASYMWIACP